MSRPPQIRVINRRDGSPPGAVYVGRPSALGNPFVVGRDGTREQVIGRYRRWLEARLAKRDAPAVLAALERIVAEVRRGKSVLLSCWCAPLPCHADVIAEVIQRLAGEAAR